MCVHLFVLHPLQLTELIESIADVISYETPSVAFSFSILLLTSPGKRSTELPVLALSASFIYDCHSGSPFFDIYLCLYHYLSSLLQSPNYKTLVCYSLTQVFLFSFPLLYCLLLGQLDNLLSQPDFTQGL